MSVRRSQGGADDASYEDPATSDQSSTAAPADAEAGADVDADAADDVDADVDAHEQIFTLADGGRILVRPLRPSDREELAAGYEELSEASRRLRFFSAPEHLSGRLLDYLVDVDGVHRLALGARALDEPGQPGVGVARFIRHRNDASCAEVAVTVLDSHRNRGIATVLLSALAEEAAAIGITTFTGSVMWENQSLLELLRAHGAVVVPDEPGVAAVRVELPREQRSFLGSTLHKALHAVAVRIGATTTNRQSAS